MSQTISVNNASIEGQPHRGWLVMAIDMCLSLFGSFLAIMMVRWMIHPIQGFQYYVTMWLLASFASTFLGIAAFKTHKMVIRHSSYRSIAKLIEASVVKICIMAVLLYTQLFHFQNFRTEALILAFDFLFTVFFLVAVRILFIIILDDLKKDVGRDVDRMCIVVYGTSDKSVAAFTRLCDSTNYIIAGFITSGNNNGGQIIHDKKVYYFETEDDLLQLKMSLGFEGVIFPKMDNASAEYSGLMSMFLNNGIHILMAPNMENIHNQGFKVHAAQSMSRESEFIPDGMTSFERNFKRIIDFCLAAFLLIVFSPLFLFCWIAVKREDHGPAIYKQERIGRFGRPFNIYKFRSMRMDAEAMGPALFSGDDDPRLTKIGKFLRLHHLDELPQLWNVFCGDMAFIGPRPERKFYIDQIMEADPRYAYLYQIRPGVTSYATLKNGYTDTLEKMLRRLEFDLYYLRHRSMWFDIKILWLTFQGIAFGKKF